MPAVSAFPPLREAREVAKRLDYPVDRPMWAQRVPAYDADDVERAAQLLVLLSDEIEETAPSKGGGDGR